MYYIHILHHIRKEESTMKDEDRARYIPNNALPNIIHHRKLIEAIMAMIITGMVITSINFVIKIKIILLITCCLAMGFLFLKGIKNRSITQIIFAEYKFRKSRRCAHLRSINYVKKNRKSFFAGVEGETTAEKTVNVLKKRLNDWKEDYRKKLISISNEDGEGERGSRKGKK